MFQRRNLWGDSAEEGNVEEVEESMKSVSIEDSEQGDTTVETCEPGKKKKRQGVIHKGRPHQGGVCQMRTLLLIFTSKRPKYADTGGRGQKTIKFFGRPL